MEKYELLPEQLLYEGTVSQEQFFEPDKLQATEILYVHTQEYWNKLQNLNLSRKEIRNIGFPVRSDLIERGRYIARGTIECAIRTIEGAPVAFNIAGGTHHAFADRGEGFCVFNDFALTARYLLHQKLVQQILIVDLDVHQGNGTAHIFQDEPSVFTFSMHGEKNYPLRKEKSDLDIGIADGSTGEMYLPILNSVLPKLIEKCKPDVILYLSGVDVLETDVLGRLSLSKNECRIRDQIVFENCYKFQIPVAVSMGGGYSPKLRDIVDAHANTYRVAHDIFG